MVFKDKNPNAFSLGCGLLHRVKEFCFTTFLWTAGSSWYVPFNYWWTAQVAERLEDMQETEASRGLIPVQICLLSSHTVIAKQM